MTLTRGKFVWYDLMTPDVASAQAFYTRAVGWNAHDSGLPGMNYTVLSAGAAGGVGGLMATPEHLKGTGPFWSGYVAVEDVDASAAQVTQAGGRVHREPSDIPQVGRFAVVADPQGADIMLFKGASEAPNPPAPGTPGTFGWHELHTTDLDGAVKFYTGLFGWEKGEGVDMGPMGTYQIFNQGGQMAGGMMKSHNPAAAPHWLYYVNTDDIEAASARVVAAGGTVLNGPEQVPGGNWVFQARDPQGAMFAMVGPKV